MDHQSKLALRKTQNSRANIVFIGFMGTGKTTVASSVARYLGLPFIDTDALIEERARRSIARIFAEDGEAAFRELEAAVVAEVSARNSFVIATGGGVVLRPENMKRLRHNGVIVALYADPRVILTRVGKGSDRPLLTGDPEGNIRHLLTEREAFYRGADLAVDTSSMSVEEVASLVVAFVIDKNERGVGERQAKVLGQQAQADLADIPSAVKSCVPAPAKDSAASEHVVRVALDARAYDVRIGRALLARVPAHLAACGASSRIVLLTHPQLDILYGQTLTGSLKAAGYNVTTVLMPLSESSKSLRTVEHLYDALVEAQVDRTTVLLVLGGGVVSDVGGFVAATFLRGIAWVAVPTTLLAQVDASIGGKTGVNHPCAKNLIGAFYQPILVLADINTLNSLSLRQIRSGIAEVVKTAVIGAPDLFEHLEAHVHAVLERQADTLVHIVNRCVEYKAGIVATDERETGGRIVLNYGHTVGHGIEAACGYRGLTHGEAISVGMTLEARVAVRLGLCSAVLLQRQTRLLEMVGLPVRLDQVRGGYLTDPAAIIGAMRYDKKTRGGRLRFVLPAGFGSIVILDDVPSVLLEETLANG
jgi:3-dehydroquinate synthase